MLGAFSECLYSSLLRARDGSVLRWIPVSKRSKGVEEQRRESSDLFAVSTMKLELSPCHPLGQLVTGYRTVGRIHLSAFPWKWTWGWRWRRNHGNICYFRKRGDFVGKLCEIVFLEDIRSNLCLSNGPNKMSITWQIVWNATKRNSVELIDYFYLGICSKREERDRGCKETVLRKENMWTTWTCCGAGRAQTSDVRTLQPESEIVEEGESKSSKVWRPF